MEHTIEQWGPDRSPELAGLVDAALPGEDLSEDELVSCCWDDPPAGSDRGRCRAGHGRRRRRLAVVWRPPPGRDEPGAPADSPFRPGAFVKLVAVHPGARRQGRGHALLAAAEAWAWDHGAGEVRLDGAPPFYLWPGVDALATEALCLAESRGYEVVGTGLNLSLPTDYRSPTPDGLDLRRVIDDADVAAVETLVNTALAAMVGRDGPGGRARLLPRRVRGHRRRRAGHGLRLPLGQPGGMAGPDGHRSRRPGRRRSAVRCCRPCAATS